jgi:Putative MetA-pathway of phenol degradation
MRLFAASTPALLSFFSACAMTFIHHARSAVQALIVGCLLLLGCVASRAQTPDNSGSAASQNSQAPASPNNLPDQITAVPNRPTFSTTAESVQSGVFEIEYGLEAGDGHQNINGLLKFGLTKNLEMRFGNNLIERDAGVAGRGDSGAGFKYKIFEEKSWRPTFSVLYTATIPTATAQVGAGAVGHSAGILFSKDFGKHHFDFNETAQWLGRPGASGFDRDYFTALAYSHGVTEKWGVTGELAGFSRTNVKTPATMTIMGAATYNWSSRLIFDLGVYFAAYGNLPRVTFFSGVTYSVADLYHHKEKKKKAD